MSWFVYSSEALPNPDFFGKAGYTPDAEYIRHAGVTLPLIPKGQWMPLPDAYPTLIHRDWTDRQGQRGRVFTSEIVSAVRDRLAERGVVFIDHEPNAAEKAAAEAASLDQNLKWRTKCIDWYENQVREKEVTGYGRTRPTPYEDECYEILKLSKPYSVEAFKAQRQPGHEAAERIATAIAAALKDAKKAEAAPAK